MKLSENLKTKTLSITAALLFGAAATLSAQSTHRLPGQHQQSHGELLANQGHSAIQVDNTNRYLESLPQMVCSRRT